MKIERKKAAKSQYLNTESGLHVRIETVLTNPSISDVYIRDKTGPWYTMIRRYQRDVGIAYYNLDVSSMSKMRRFLLKYIIVAKLPDKSDTEGAADLEDMMRIFREDQPGYKDILTKVVRKEPLSEDEMSDMSSRLNDSRIPTNVSQRNGTLILGFTNFTGSICAKGVLRAAYYFLLLPSTGNIELKRCAIEECTNFFVPHAGGHPQKYCSDSCKVKAYNRRKKTAWEQ